MIWVVARQVGKTGNFSAIVDRCRSVPGDASQVSNVNRLAVFPEHGVFGTQGADRFVASAGDADGLASVVDRGRSRIRIALERKEPLDLAASWSPEDRLELKHLGRNASWVVKVSFCPAD